MLFLGQIVKVTLDEDEPSKLGVLVGREYVKRSKDKDAEYEDSYTVLMPHKSDKRGYKVWYMDRDKIHYAFRADNKKVLWGNTKTKKIASIGNVIKEREAHLKVLASNAKKIDLKL